MDIAVKSGYPEAGKGKLLKRRIACQEALKTSCLKRQQEFNEGATRHQDSHLERRDQSRHHQTVGQETNPDNKMTKSFDNKQERESPLATEKQEFSQEFFDSESFSSSSLHFMHDNLTIFEGCHERGGGRRVRCTTSDITTNSELMRESCYSWILYPDFWSRFCYHCLKKLALPSSITVFPGNESMNSLNSEDSKNKKQGDHCRKTDRSTTCDDATSSSGTEDKKNNEEEQTIERHSPPGRTTPTSSPMTCEDTRNRSLNHIPSASLLWYSCWKCTQIRFCSLSCRSQAWKLYHEKECGFLNLLQDMDNDTLLTLRVLLMQGIKSFLSESSSCENKRKEKPKPSTPKSQSMSPNSTRDVRHERKEEGSSKVDKRKRVGQHVQNQMSQEKGEEMIEPLQGFGGFNRLVFHPHLSREVEKESLSKATFILSFFLERTPSKKTDTGSCIAKKESEELSLSQLLSIRNQIDKQIRKCQVNSMHLTVREIEIQEHSPVDCSSSSSSSQDGVDRHLTSESPASSSQNSQSPRQTSLQGNPLKRPEDVSLVEKRIGCATFTTLSFLNHSCDPNAKVIRFDGKCMTLIASRDIKAGEEVFISYGLFSKYHTVSHRRQELFSTYRFLCCCNACSHEIEPTFNALKCPDCHGPIPWKEQESEDEKIEDDVSKKNEEHGKHDRSITSDATHDNKDYYDDDGSDRGEGDVARNGIIVGEERSKKSLEKVSPEGEKELTVKILDTGKNIKSERTRQDQEDKKSPELLLSSSSPSSSTSSTEDVKYSSCCLDCRRTITGDDFEERKCVILSGSRLLSQGMDELYLASGASSPQDKNLLLNRAIRDLKESFCVLSKVLYRNHVQLSISLDQLSIACKRAGRMSESLTFGKEYYKIVASSMDEDVYLFNSLFKLLDCYRFAILQERTSTNITSDPQEQEALKASKKHGCSQEGGKNHSNKCNTCSDKRTLEMEGESMLKSFTLMLNNLLPANSQETDFYNKQLFPLRNLLKLKQQE
jgi:hypothetical protein